MIEIILLLLVISGGGLGARRGFVRELLGIAHILLAAYLSLEFVGVIQSLLLKVTSLERGADTEIASWIAGTVLLYVVLFLLLYLAGRLLKRLRFKGDAISGAALGVIRVSLLLALLLPAIAWTSSEDGAVQRAVTGIRPWGWLRNGAARVSETPFVPAPLVEFVEDTPEIWK